MAKYNAQRAYQIALLKIEKARDTGVKELTFDNYGLVSLPPEIRHLTNLTKLNLIHNRLDSLPPEIGQLDNLSNLILSDNLIRQLPPEIGRLKHLVSLDLNFNHLSQLPSEIGQLTNLDELLLDGNQLSNLPPEIRQLTNLSVLFISNNNFSHFPEEIFSLTNLNDLSIYGNQLIQIPRGIGNLLNLTGLDLPFNQLNQLPPEIGQLSNLKFLSLWNNELSVLPKQIGKLKNLTLLSVHSNQLRILPPEVGELQNLAGLDISFNQLSQLPTELTQLTNLKSLDLRGNPKLEIPPEIVEDVDNPLAILNYIAGMQDPSDERRKLNEAKIILVGQGGVGKTSLVNRLVHGAFHHDEAKTPGVNITDWTVPDKDGEIEVHLWDFGGQEIMHAATQFFLTRRSLYLLVVDCRLSEEDNRLDYWLEIISTFGKDSPIIVVGNKVDQHPLDLNMPGLQKKYPTIQAFVATSAMQEKGLGELSDLIEEQIPQLPNVKDTLPRSWFNLKERLEEMKEPYIYFNDYQQICLEEGLEEQKAQESVLGFLHELGIVFAYREEGVIPLEHTQVLNPNWVTQGVYKILNDVELIREKGGIFGWKDLRRVLSAPDYPSDLHRGFIMELMRKFEHAFQWGHGKQQRFLVPDLLPKSEIETGNWEDALKFEYHYEVLLPGLLSRIMVRHNEDIVRNMSWRTGAVFKCDGNEALIQADKSKDILRIAVRGEPATRRDYLAALRMDIDRINRGLNVTVTQHVPVPAHPDVLVDYQHVKKMAKMGEAYIIPAGLTERVQIKDLLGEYRSEKELEQENLEKRFTRVEKKLDEVKQEIDKDEKDPDQKPTTGQGWIWSFFSLVIGVAFLIWIASTFEVDPLVFGSLILLVIALEVFVLTTQGIISGKEAVELFKKLIDRSGKGG